MIRISYILPNIISPEQCGFVKGKNINGNILLAQELIQSIKKKTRGSNMVMKLDISMAYDSLSWLALIKILRNLDSMRE